MAQCKRIFGLWVSLVLWMALAACTVRPNLTPSAQPTQTDPRIVFMDFYADW